MSLLPFLAAATVLLMFALVPLVRVLSRPAGALAGPPQRLTGAVLVVALPLATAGLYALTGTPAALAPPRPAALADAARDTASDSAAITPERIQAMVARLAARLQDRPDDADGWRMLARSYETLGRYGDAVAAYRSLQRLTPDDNAMLLDYAVTLAMSQGRTLSGAPAALIAQVLQRDPRNPQALALAGSEAYERRDAAAAVRHWQAVLDQVPPGSEIAASVQASIEQARALERAP